MLWPPTTLLPQTVPDPACIVAGPQPPVAEPGRGDLGLRCRPGQGTFFCSVRALPGLSRPAAASLVGVGRACHTLPTFPLRLHRTAEPRLGLRVGAGERVGACGDWAEVGITARWSIRPNDKGHCAEGCTHPSFRHFYQSAPCTYPTRHKWVESASFKVESWALGLGSSESERQRCLA